MQDEPQVDPGTRVRRRFTSGDSLMLVAIVAMLGAVVYPAYKKYRVTSVDHAVQENLGALAAAADQYFLEHTATVVAVSELVGPSRALKSLDPVANETYPKVVVQGDSLVAKGVDGVRSVTVSGLFQPAYTKGLSQPFLTMSAADLTRVVDNAKRRTVEVVTPVTPTDLVNMPSSYEWGSGTGQRMWRRISPALWHEVYPDGRYSQFPILGRATVNGILGTIAAKDDGSLEVFIPDKGSRMVHVIGAGGSWSDYMPMDKVK